MVPCFLMFCVGEYGRQMQIYYLTSREKYVKYFNGAVAQLGARLTGSQKVTGSNPVSSIIIITMQLLANATKPFLYHAEKYCQDYIRRDV